MARPPRFELAGGVFHVTTRSSAKRAILPHDEARARCIELVRLARYGWQCHAFVVMTTHYHLLVTTLDPNLSRGMQWLNGCYGRIFNEDYATHGHVFGARFASRHVASEAHLLNAVSYIAMNPVGAGLCRRPEDWRFSSYRALVGGGRAGFLELERVLKLFAFDKAEARRMISEFVCPDDLTP